MIYGAPASPLAAPWADASGPTTVPALARPAPAAAMEAVPAAFLLALYLIVPVSLTLLIADCVLLDGAKTVQLPWSPESYLLFAIFFEMPHIVASTLLLADAPYLTHYGRKLAWGTAAFLGAIVAAQTTFGAFPLLAVLAGFTVYHVMGQQCGIARMLIGKTDGTFCWWKGVSIGTGIALFAAAYFIPVGADYEAALGFDLIGVLDIVCTVSMFWTMWLTFRLITKSLRPIAKLYVFAHGSLILGCYISHMLRVPFFVWLMPRIVHDLTAFAFYICHDVNRNQTHKFNWLHKVGAWLRCPAWAVTPVAAVLLAYPVTRYCLRSEDWIWVYFSLSALHFYTESFTWKGTNPHRGHVRLI